MRHGLGAAAPVLLAGLVLLALAWLVPDLLDGSWLAATLLKANYSLPELMSSYVPELRRATRLSLAVAAGAALLAFLLWIAGTSMARPTGPGQVARGWRRVTWWVIGVIAVGAVFACVAFATLGGLDSVDAVMADRAAAVLAVATALVFWLFSLLGTERLMRPAVPCGAFLVGRK